MKNQSVFWMSDKLFRDNCDSVYCGFNTVPAGNTEDT